MWLIVRVRLLVGLLVMQLLSLALVSEPLVTLQIGSFDRSGAGTNTADALEGRMP